MQCKFGPEAACSARVPAKAAVFALVVAGASVPGVAGGPNPNEPGILEPVTWEVLGQDVRIPGTDQTSDGSTQVNLVGTVERHDALGRPGPLGWTVTRVSSPNQDARSALQDMVVAAQADDEAALTVAAAELMDILLGTTQGRLYDGFALLDFNRWSDPSIPDDHFPPDQVAPEYETKWAVDRGGRIVSPFDGQTRVVWEIEVDLLFYDDQVDSDTSLVLLPWKYHSDDTLRVNYRIFSVDGGVFAPTAVLDDRQVTPDTVQQPFKGLDSVWLELTPESVLEATVDYPPVGMLRGIVHRDGLAGFSSAQMLRPVFELTNDLLEIEPEPESRSLGYRSQSELTLDAIGDAAPEKKMYAVASAALQGTPASKILQFLTEEDSGPRGTWEEWADLAADHQQIPLEAWDALDAAGMRGDALAGRAIAVFLNNEIYAVGDRGRGVSSWGQGVPFDVFAVNLDDHPHYFRVDDLGPRLHDDLARCCDATASSYEIFSIKPLYGVPKAAEVGWRAGWGFRPHYDVIQQPEVFSTSDLAGLRPFSGGSGGGFEGYQYSTAMRQGDFRFNPPPFVIGTETDPSMDALRDADDLPGLVVGQRTPGFGTAQFCPADAWPGFCSTDVSAYNPYGVLNWPPPPLRGTPGFPDDATELRFPPYLRSPSQGDASAGDLIPLTDAWRPFLYVNPGNGGLFLDPADPDAGFWVDRTFAHGAPVPEGGVLRATIEAPRASGQALQLSDGLFSDDGVILLETRRPALLLRGGRFEVDVAWRTFNGQTGEGTPHPLSPDSGYFTFFHRDNAEVFVKILDACVPPWNRFWVFDTHLSNVEFTITVTDTQTGQVHRVFNPLGYTPPAVLDTGTIFTECGGGHGAGLPPAETIDTSTLPPIPTPINEETVDPTVAMPCVEDPYTICLNEDRFRVWALYEDFAGVGGRAKMWALTADSGYATFFSDSNVELFIKVLNACGLEPFNDYWVFVGGLSNVPIELYVEDTATGKVWHTTNPSGRTFATHLDTQTFFTDCD